MSEKIEPALGAEEWRDAFDPDMREGLAYEVCYVWGKARPAAAIAIANAALPDSDPRKITREAVTRLREVLVYDHEFSTADVELLNGLADALESYLPPASE